MSIRDWIILAFDKLLEITSDTHKYIPVTVFVTS